MVSANVVPQLSFLEPVDASGKRCDFWCKLVQHQMESGKSVGRSVARPPSESLLGTGSYGRVWRAHDRRSGLAFAVKNVGEDDADHELNVLRHLRHFAHPCVVRFHGEESFPDVRLTSLYLEFCSGGDLQAAVASARAHAMRIGKPYNSPDDAHRWLCQIFSALEYLHLVADVLHLDVKLSNVLLDEEGCAKLADFGSSHLGASTAVAWLPGNSPPGSPGYAAPEVLLRQSCDAKADLFSLGMLTWVLFTGGSPDQPEPSPPQSGQRWSASSSDPNCPDVASTWTLMQEEVRALLARSAPAVGEFVQELLCWSPADRPSHAKLRERALLREGEVMHAAPGPQSHRGSCREPGPRTDKPCPRAPDRDMRVLVECN